MSVFYLCIRNIVIPWYFWRWLAVHTMLLLRNVNYGLKWWMKCETYIDFMVHVAGHILFINWHNSIWTHSFVFVYWIILGPDVLKVLEPPEGRMSLDLVELVATYRAAAVGLITTFWDGINIIPYEFTASQDEENPGTILLLCFIKYAYADAWYYYYVWTPSLDLLSFLQVLWLSANLWVVLDR